MSDFYRDELDGSGDMDGRIPDVGSALTAPDVDLGDGTYVQAAADNLSTALQLNAGAMRVNDTIAVDGLVIVKLTPPGPNHFTEIKINATPATEGAFISVLGRTSPEAANLPNGVNFIGGYFGFGADSVSATKWQSLEGTSGYGVSGSTPSDYPVGPYDITLRVEFEDDEVRFLVDGAIILTFAIVDSEFVATGEIYVALDMSNFTAHLSDMKFLRMRAGSLPETPEGNFWIGFIKSTERDF